MLEVLVVLTESRLVSPLRVTVEWAGHSKSESGWIIGSKHVSEFVNLTYLLSMS